MGEPGIVGMMPSPTRPPLQQWRTGGGGARPPPPAPLPEEVRSWCSGLAPRLRMEEETSESMLDLAEPERLRRFWGRPALARMVGTGTS